MKRALSAIAAFASLFLLAFPLTAQTTGTWSAHDLQDDRLQMNIRYGTSQHGNSMRIAELTGLQMDQLRAANAPVSFTLQREAGTVFFTGTFLDGQGSGHFRFEPDPSYARRLEAAGVDVQGTDDKPLTESKQLSMALLDVSSERARELRALGYSQITLKDLISTTIHRVTPEYIRSMRAAGFEDLSLKKLVSYRIHRVTPEFAREIRAAGIEASANDLTSMSIHGVTVEWIRELEALGYRGLSAKKLTSMRIHRVSTEFIRELRQLGYDDVSADELVSMRIHRVTPEYIRELRKAGYGDLQVRKLISMRIHGGDLVRTRSRP